MACRAARFLTNCVMLENSIRRTPRPQDLIGMSTQQLRDTFQISNLFVPGEITGHFTDLEERHWTPAERLRYQRARGQSMAASNSGARTTQWHTLGEPMTREQYRAIP